MNLRLRRLQHKKRRPAIITHTNDNENNNKLAFKSSFSKLSTSFPPPYLVRVTALSFCVAISFRMDES